MAPTRATDERFKDWWATYLRRSASPGAALAFAKMNTQIDITNILPTIRVPTLIVHRSGDLDANVGGARYMARQIPGAKYVELPGDDQPLRERVGPFAPLRADDRFWTAANRLGLVRYWQVTKTWPDFCAATAPPIDCPALAARASGTRVAAR
jgi:hypothetical protein